MVVLSVGEFLWTCLAIFFMVIYFMMLFQVIVDVFRRRDASGGKKAGWLILLFIVPFVSLIAYMLMNSEGMAQRQQDLMEARGYRPSGGGNGVGGSGPASEIASAKALLDSGAISQEEYQSIKSRVLA
jgi:phospholipase D-like protein/putative oligomerization/nucleic acid binding protein